MQEPANLPNTIFLIWHIGQVLAPEENMSIFVCLMELKLCFLTASHLLRESHADLSGGINVIFTVLTPQDAADRIGSAVWMWKCGIEILGADVGA